MRALIEERKLPEIEKNVPAMHRAVLFWVWKMSELTGWEYTDKVANAISTLIQEIEMELREEVSAVVDACVGYQEKDGQRKMVAGSILPLRQYTSP